jgi:hypothetical protein
MCSDLPLDRVRRLSGKGLARLFEAWKTVNAEFLSADETIDSSAGSDPTSEQAQENPRQSLDTCLFRLINHGHVNAFDYGYSFFRVCLDEILKKERQAEYDRVLQLKELSVLVRTAWGAEKQAFERFLKSYDAALSKLKAKPEPVPINEEPAAAEAVKRRRARRQARQQRKED